MVLALRFRTLIYFNCYITGPPYRFIDIVSMFSILMVWFWSHGWQTCFRLWLVFLFYAWCLLLWNSITFLCIQFIICALGVYIGNFSLLKVIKLFVSILIFSLPLCLHNLSGIDFYIYDELGSSFFFPTWKTNCLNSVYWLSLQICKTTYVIYQVPIYDSPFLGSVYLCLFQYYLILITRNLS